MSRRKSKKKPGRRGLFYKRMTPEEEVEQRERAFAAIRRLYAEVLPLWRSCLRGHCRRHKNCAGDIRPCLERVWRLTPESVRQQAFKQVMRGGPRRVPPASRMEQDLRRFPPTNFVH
jgi:hypothetical protein